MVVGLFCFKQKTAYEVRISDWSSDVCSSDLVVLHRAGELATRRALLFGAGDVERQQPGRRGVDGHRGVHLRQRDAGEELLHVAEVADRHADLADLALGERVVAVVAGLRRQVEGDGEPGLPARQVLAVERVRSEEHTSELQSLMRISYAVFCL